MGMTRDVIGDEQEVDEKWRVVRMMEGRRVKRMGIRVRGKGRLLEGVWIRLRRRSKSFLAPDNVL